MLVLSRRPFEGIVIGSDIKITVVKIDRNQVRIGIQAPGDVAVWREEIVHTMTNTQDEDAAVHPMAVGS